MNPETKKEGKLYGVLLYLQEPEITKYCFKECGKILLGSVYDVDVGPMFVCREEECPFLETQSTVMGTVEGEEIYFRKLRSIK